MTTRDCIAETPEEKALPETHRHFTVGYVTRGPKYTRISAIIMKGRWLDVEGFRTGTALDVKVTKGRIVITVKPRQVPTLQQLATLSARERKRIFRSATFGE